MLHKDEYNQEDYNDYYRQETEGAEITGEAEEKNGLMGKLIIFLLLFVLAIAGYFGYKVMNNSSATDNIDTSLKVSVESSLPKSVQKEEKEKPQGKIKILEAEDSPSIQTKVTQEVIKEVNSQGKMSAEDVAAVVASVMKKMNKEKEAQNATQPIDSVNLKADTLLIGELSETEVDSVSADLIKKLENVNIDEDIQVHSDNKKIDVYNKVTIKESTSTDVLSQLSSQINSVMQEDGSIDKNTYYTTLLTKEVNVRKNEMRVIIVRQGDTLGKIASRAYGNARDYTKIYQANPEVTKADRIFIGQKLRIPN